MVAAFARPAPADPLAGGPIGARALGRGGAVVASARGASALAVNPAGLTQGDGVALELGLGLDGVHVGFQRRSTDKEYPHAESHAAAAELLLAGVTAAFAGGRIALGAAYYQAGAYAVDYPASPASSNPPIVDPQRYMVRSFAASRSALAAGVAARPLPWLSLGAAFLAQDVRVNYDRKAWLGFDADQLEDPRLDMPFQIALEDSFVPGLGAGLVLSPPGTPLQLGASLELSADAHTTGTLTAGTPVMLPAGWATFALDGSQRLQATLPMPLVLRAGARLGWRRVDVETAAEIDLFPGAQPWLAHSDLGVVLGRQVGDPSPTRFAVDPVPLGIVPRTGFALRAGGDLVLLPGLLTGRAGYAYLSAATDSPLASAIEPGAARQVFSLGLAAEGAGLTLEASYSHAFEAARSVDASAWQHWNPLGGASADVGSGRYTGSADRVVVSLRVALGQARRAFAPPRPPPNPCGGAE